jgi:hypothetical protein
VEDEAQPDAQPLPLSSVQPLALAAAQAGELHVRTLKLGERVALDSIGPVVVNADCTLRRIENWGDKLDHEQATIQRVVAARNAGRLERCRELEAESKQRTDAEL